MERLHYHKDESKWMWSYDKDFSDTYWCTSNYGEGVFLFHEGEMRQLEGTLQFSLVGLTDASAKNKIRRYMNQGEDF